MQAGRLDRLITVQRKTQTIGEDGHPTDVWSTLGAQRRPASVRPVRGDERFTAPQYVASEQVEFRIRYADTVDDLTPLDRIIYPALEPDSPSDPVETRRQYDILAVHEIGRNEGLLIFTARRSDVVI